MVILSIKGKWRLYFPCESAILPKFIFYFYRTIYDFCFILIVKLKKEKDKQLQDCSSLDIANSVTHLISLL